MYQHGLAHLAAASRATWAGFGVPSWPDSVWNWTPGRSPLRLR